MSRILAADEVCEGLNRLLIAARAPGRASFGRAIIDSREATAADLFFALHGEHSDGHDFASQALSAGAAGAVVERPMATPDERALFQVSDSLAALQALATHRRRSCYGLRVIGVTGSVGKTTCKELIASVLATKYNVLKSEGNLNTEIGIPLTLLRLQDEHQKAVLEMAMYARGDIALLARVASPHVG